MGGLGIFTTLTHSNLDALRDQEKPQVNRHELGVSITLLPLTNSPGHEEYARAAVGEGCSDYRE